jgi:hypothetical protein
MDDLQRFSAQCWQLVDVMQIPVKALRIVQVQHSHFGVKTCAAGLLKASQRPLYQFLRRPWNGFALRLAARNRARFNVYDRFVEEALQNPEHLNLVILLDALDVWAEGIEADSHTRGFHPHGCVAGMTALIADLEGSISECDIRSRLALLQGHFLQLEDMVTGSKEASSEPAEPCILSVPRSS